MATATKQLEAIYQEITERFSGDPAITVTPIDGDPPEKYEITYNIKSIFKDESGDIQEKDSHTISINIPFGFPHFPPSCKPKSQIFHPDFDPAAICIGDFWEKERSIGDLIYHIGQMIAGSSYSTSNAFNEEAAKWYQANSDRLPFDSLDEPSDSSVGDDLVEDLSLPVGHDSDDVSALLDDDQDEDITEGLGLDFSEDQESPMMEVPGASLDSEEQTDEEVVDTLDDSFLETDFDYLGDKKSDPETDEIVLPKPDPVEIEAGSSIDTDRFRLMARQKRFYELEMELSDLPGHQDFEGRANLADQASEAISQARELYNQGTESEHQGSPAQALEAFLKVEKIVSDYPGLKEDIERTTQAKELLGDWLDTPSPPPVEEQESPETEEMPVVEQEPKTSKKSGRTFFEDTAKKTTKLIPYAIGLGILLMIGTVGVIYFLNSSTLTKAKDTFANCQAVLKQNRFSEAERQCESALNIAKEVQYFKSGDRDKLIVEVNGVLNSQPLLEGLKGNLLLDGKYLPKEVVKTITAFRYFMAEGDKHFADKSWQQAESSYQQALNIANQREGVDPKLVFAVTEFRKIAEFRDLLRSGTKFISSGKWVMATEHLNKALALVQTLNIEDKAETVNTITAKLAEIALATAKEKGDAAFAEGRWKNALDNYQNALKAGKEFKGTDKRVLDEIQELVVKANLYYTISTGKNAFTDSNWDAAIDNYNRAIEILEQNREVLKQTSSEENRKKLARIKLQASVIRDKQEAATYLKNKEYEKANKKLKSIIDSIFSSEFSKEAEFIAVINDTENAIKKNETDLLLQDKITYLEENFEELFTANYTVTTPESLTERTVVFDKQEGDKLIFKLQCVEVGRGRPLRLVMKYEHDLKTGKWRFFGNTQ